MGGNTAGVPADRLQAGEKFSVEYAPVEHELSRKVGTVRHATPVSMRNEWSTVRIYHKVPGTMLNKKIAVGIPLVGTDESGKVVKKTENMWMLHEEWAVEQQFAEYKNNVLAFGVSNRNSNGEYLNIGKSGNVIQMGDGLFAQMEAANTIHYSKFSLKLLESVLYELMKGCKPQDRHVVIRTGMWGALQFHKEVTKEISGWTFFSMDNVGAVRKTTSKDHPNALAAGFKFTEWISPMGFKVTIDVDPWYDDDVRNKIPHSSGNGLAQSYRMDIMDMGPKDNPNIFKCAIKGMPEMTGFQWGPFANPWNGQTNNAYASYDEDSATIHKKATLGICVLDPTRTVSLIPVELQGYN